MTGMVVSNTYRAAAAALCKTLANENGRHGVRVNVVGPGLTETDRFRAVVASRAREEGVDEDVMLAKMCADIPLERVNTPDNFGDVVAWISGPSANYITGQVLTIDGGLTQCPL